MCSLVGRVDITLTLDVFEIQYMSPIVYAINVMAMLVALNGLHMFEVLILFVFSDVGFEIRPHI